MSWDVDLDADVRRYAAAERVTMAEWVRELVRREIRRREAK